MLLFRCSCERPIARERARISAISALWETVASPGGKTVQRTVLYLGEINDQQQAAWRKTLEVFYKQEQRYTSLSLFPDDREIPPDAGDSMQVKLSGLELRRPQISGHCWLARELWQQVGLGKFWQTRLPEAREAVSWEKMPRLLVVSRLLDQTPSSACIGNGSRIAPWMNCFKATSQWPRRIGCIGVWTES
jgi:hypothetical protein